MFTLVRCECGNIAEPGIGLCAACDLLEAHECDEGAADSMTFHPASLSARCDLCGLLIALWECPCDLAHDCRGDMS